MPDHDDLSDGAPGDDATPTEGAPEVAGAPEPPPSELAGLRTDLGTLAERVSALAEGDTDRRAAAEHLGTLLEEIGGRVGEVSEAAASLRTLAPDLQAALVEVGRRVGELAASTGEMRRELSAIGPRVNQLLDRRPDWDEVTEPIEARLDAQDSAQAADRELLERTLALLEAMAATSDEDGDSTADAALAETVTEAVRGAVAPLTEAVTRAGAVGRAGDDGVAPADLARLAEAVERLGHRLTDGLGSVRDAAMAPAEDLQALISARADRTDARFEQLAAELATLNERAAAPAPRAEAPPASPPPPPPPPPPAPPPIDVDRLVADVAAAVTAQVGEIVDTRVRAAVSDALDERAPGDAEPSEPGAALEVVPPPSLAEIDERLEATSEEIRRAVADRTEGALASLLRLLDERLTTVTDDLAVLSDAVESARSERQQPAGFEAGAVLGASQAAWARLESRIDAEFDDVGRQLHSLGVLVERALEVMENRQPLVTGEGIRKAAASVRDTVVGASRSRRDRRGGPRGLGPGSGSG
jgi:hypothetical protein